MFITLNFFGFLHIHILFLHEILQNIIKLIRICYTLTKPVLRNFLIKLFKVCCHTLLANLSKLNLWNILPFIYRDETAIGFPNIRECCDIFFSLNRYIQEERKSFQHFLSLSAFKRRIFIQPLSKSLRQEWISKPFDYVNGCLTLLLAFSWCSSSFEFEAMCIRKLWSNWN